MIGSRSEIFAADLTKLRQLTPTLEKVIAINNYGRSGSVLLQSLFDGHPCTIVTPGYFLSAFYLFFEGHCSLPTDALIDNFMAEFEHIFDGNAAVFWGFSSLGANQDQCLQVSKELFRTCLSAILADCSAGVPRKLFFQAVHVAYKYALGEAKEINSNTRIIFPLHSPLPTPETAKFAQDFPEAKFVLMVREPIATLSSTLRLLPSMLNQWFYWDSALYPALFGGVPSAKGVESNSCAVRLEDLHRSPRKTMERLCRWLSFPWHDCLMDSTFNGKKWWGDGSSPRINGFSESVVTKRHAPELSPLDIFRLNVLLEAKKGAWQYETSSDANRTLLRKLIVLPLLMVPFATETQSLLKERQQKMSLSLQKLATQRLTRTMKLLYWFIGLGTLARYSDIRRHLLVSWAGTFAKSPGELPIIQVDHNSVQEERRSACRLTVSAHSLIEVEP